VPTIAELQQLARERSPFDREKTEGVLADHFAAMQRRLRFALERWPELEQEAVLDVGCSYGHCLAHFGPGSVGIDSNPQHVAFCVAIGLEARVIDANRPEDLAPSSFDTIWICDVLEHLNGPRAALRSLKPVLKPDGRILVFLTLAPALRPVRAALRRVDGAFDAHAHHYQFTYDTARYLIERAGFSVTASVSPLRLTRRTTTRIYFEARPDEALERIAARAELRNEGGTTRPPL
jgi:SAM-dependent methyltransferase